MSIPQHILDQLDYATCSICGELVTVKGRATHVICTLAAIEAGYGLPQTFIVGMEPQKDAL